MTRAAGEQRVFLIDDDAAVRDAMSLLFDSVDLPHRCFASADAFFEEYDGSQRGCLVLDLRMPGMTGLELQQRLNAVDSTLPIIFITGHGDVPMAVEAMRRGAFDFLRKPVDESELLARIDEALHRESGDWHQKLDRDALEGRIETLTEREREVFERVATGLANKAIAAELGISERTVEVHRSQVMKKLDVRTVAGLVRVHLLIAAPTGNPQ